LSLSLLLRPTRTSTFIIFVIVFIVFNSAERLRRVLGDARRPDRSILASPTSRRLARGSLGEPSGTTATETEAMMEDLEDLEQEDMKARGLRIEKCVDEVLRSHLVERPLNTRKNYIPKQKVNQAPINTLSCFFVQ
jgi:hypothetical protein